MAKGGGQSPQPFGRVSGAPGAAQTPNMTDFRPLKIENYLPKYNHGEVQTNAAHLLVRITWLIADAQDWLPERPANPGARRRPNLAKTF